MGRVYLEKLACNNYVEGDNKNSFTRQDLQHMTTDLTFITNETWSSWRVGAQYRIWVMLKKNSVPQANAFALEREIDELVYQLYGLTEDEVKIVEGK